MAVEEYFDDLASFYDAYYGTEGLGGDLEFYRELASEADAVLEVGCGTGRIYLELLANGVDADGIDVSSGMLEVLRDRATERGLEATVWEADVRTFEADREYDLVIVPFRTFLHLLEVDDQLSALGSIHDALAPGGRLALNTFVPSYEVICDHYGEVEQRTLEVDGEEYLHRTVTELDDEVEQVARIRSEVCEPDGTTVFESETPITLLSRREFELLFRLSPFSDWDIYGGFEYDSLESADEEMVWVARR